MFGPGMLVSRLSDLTYLNAWALKILFWSAAAFAILCFALLPPLLLARQWKAVRILTSHLFVLPLFLGALYLTFLIFVWQAMLISSVSRQTPPHEALRTGIRSRLQQEGLSAPGGQEDPYEFLARGSPRFAQSKYSGSARWTVRAAGRALSLYDLALLAVLFGSFLAAVVPVATDILGYPWRKQGLFSMLWRVFRRLLAMLLYLALGALVFALFAVVFTWLTYFMTNLASRLIADASIAATRAAPFLVFLQVLAAAFFLIETTALLALSMAAISLSAGAAIKLWLNGVLLREARPRGRFRETLAAFGKLVLKVALACAGAFLVVRGISLVSPAAALPVCILVETVGFNLALALLKAHRDAKRLFGGCWELNTFGVRTAVKNL